LGVVGMAILSVAAHSTASTTPSAASVASHTAQDMAAGIGMGLVAGFTYALYSWVARRLMQHGIPSRAAMGGMFGLGGLFLMPVLYATGAPFLQSWTNASVGLYMALIPMFLGYLFFGYGLARISASTATTITLLEPVVAAALAAAIVGERLTPWAWAGIGLIFLSLAWITWPTKPRQSAVAASAAH
jgi:DME family drug/metabolite transporter